MSTKYLPFIMSFILLQHSLTAENANSVYQRLYNIETLQYCDRNFSLGYFKLKTSFFSSYDLQNEAYYTIRVHLNFLDCNQQPEFGGGGLTLNYVIKHIV